MKKSPLVILLLTVLLDLIGFGIVLPLLPTYAKDLGASPLMIGLIAAIFSITRRLRDVPEIIKLLAISSGSCFDNLAHCRCRYPKQRSRPGIR